MHCKKCGALLPERGSFCPKCGTPRESGQPTPTPAPAGRPRPQTNRNTRSTKKLTIAVLVLVVLLLAVGGVLVYVLCRPSSNLPVAQESSSIQRADREKPVATITVQPPTETQTTQPEPAQTQPETDTQPPVQATEPETTQETPSYDLSDPYSFTGDYYCPDSDRRYYTEDDVAWMNHNRDYLQMAMNEIYARHGYNFQTPEIRAYFESKPWYVCTCEPGAFDASVLSACEMENLMLFEELKAPK